MSDPLLSDVSLVKWPQMQSLRWPPLPKKTTPFLPLGPRLHTKDKESLTPPSCCLHTHTHPFLYTLAHTALQAHSCVHSCTHILACTPLCTLLHTLLPKPLAAVPILKGRTTKCFNSPFPSLFPDYRGKVTTCVCVGRGGALYSQSLGCLDSVGVEAGSRRGGRG